jgi:SAM-dependent methyltransferase
MLRRLHDKVHLRRVGVLARHLDELLPREASVLDVGCGDGLLARRIMERRSDLTIQGLDVLVRKETHVPMRAFDGRQLPGDGGSVDVVMFIDVLHHTTDPMVLLREAARVARQAVVIKDHTRDGLLAGPTLRFMDYVGNAHHGVALPYNYWPRRRWLAAFEELELSVRAWRDDLGLYSGPSGWLFDRSLHFVSSLERSGLPANRRGQCACERRDGGIGGERGRTGER